MLLSRSCGCEIKAGVGRTGNEATEAGVGRTGNEATEAGVGRTGNEATEAGVGRTGNETNVYYAPPLHCSDKSLLLHKRLQK